MQDINLRNDFTIPDRYRLAPINALFEAPLDAVAFIDSLAKRVHETEIGSLLPPLSSYLSIEIGKTAPGKVGFDSLIRKLSEIKKQLGIAYKNTPAVLPKIFEKLTVFDPRPTETIEEEKQKDKESDSLVVQLKKMGEMVDYEKIFSAACKTVNLIENCDYKNLLQKTKKTIPGVEGYVYAYGKADFGEYVIGAEGDNVYRKNFALIIDVGGNDMYTDTKSTLFGISIIIDLKGNDTYQGGNCSLASGYFGIGILFDLEGDDTYQAGSFSLAAGVFGVGLLCDKKGNDKYFGDTFTQGAGGFGIGILKDLEGNDFYNCALYGQGFGNTYGIGILADGSGNDTYFAGGKYLDEIRYLDHFLSLSQGFSIGFRPDLSGGIGLLTDLKGNDNYISDIFGQGCGYWYSLGGLVDFEGNDSYLSYQYSQGAATHLAMGVLIDKAGDDNYISKGVSQGCGHDLSLGLLLDEQGADSYSAFDLSQGAGNANGFGILVDLMGDDNYLVKRKNNTQGYGDFRREYGSLGLLLDLKGIDVFSFGQNQSLWTKGRYGLGLDKE